MLTQELQERQAGTVVKTGRKVVDPFIFSTEMIRDLRLMEFAAGVLRLGKGTRPVLPAASGGRPSIVVRNRGCAGCQDERRRGQKR